MTKFLAFILTLFISLVLKGQVSDTTLISKADIRQFFSDIRQSELATGQMLLINQPFVLRIETVLFYTGRNREIFQSLDTGFIVRQINSYKNSQWDTTLIDRTIIIDQNTFDTIFKNSKEGSGWQKFRSIYGKEDLYSLSLPIFTKDRNYCIVEINRSCGSLCGTYCTIIFKRRGNQWKRFKELECGVN